LFLAYLFILLPWLAMRSTRPLRTAGSAAGLPREAVWRSALIGQVFLFGLAWIAGRGFGFEIFAAPAMGLRDAGAALAALAALWAVFLAVRALRREEDRRRLIVFQLAPRTGREWTLWSATVVAASVAEEAAYRGVGMNIVWYWSDNFWLAVLLCAAAFALAHWSQGLISGAAIFLIALVMHALVTATGTLVLAMAVHAAYDFAAGVCISREAMHHA
jgi:membrane protease YdiL (CAAX protease family)